MAANDDQGMPVPDTAPRAQSAVLGLKPISPNLEPQVRLFVAELRSVFGQLEISLGEFARRHYRDKSGLSRFLSGNRIPSRELLDELIAEITRLRGIPLTDRKSVV